METTSLSSAPAPQGSPASVGSDVPPRAARGSSPAPKRRSRASQRSSEGHRWLARSGVLASLAAATIVIPITAGAGGSSLAPQTAAALAPAGLEHARGAHLRAHARPKR